MWTPEFEGVRHLVKQTKYLKTNPLRQFLIGQYLAAVSSLVAQTRVKEILDVGCGEGFVTRHLSQEHHDVQLVGAEA